MRNKKNILVVVTERNSANGICAKAIMRECMKRGHNVVCVTNREYNDPHFFINDNIIVYTVKPRLIYTIESYLASKNDKTWKEVILSIFRFVLNKIELLLSVPLWPLISRGYSKRIYRLIKLLHSKHRFDVVIPIYTQIDTIIAANRLKKVSSNIKVVPYMLDSLAAGYGPKIFSKEWVERRGLKWEKRLFKDVDHIVMMKSSENFYIKHNNLRYMSLVSFLDIPLFVCKNKVANSTNVRPVISYVGSIPAHIRNPEYFLTVFKALGNLNLKLLIVGPSTCDSLLQQYISSDMRIERINSVPHSKAIEIIDESDILLNLGNNLTTMMPSKIFEYISTGKPIISTAPIKDEPCIRYLEKYGNACILYESDPIDYSAKKMLDFIRTSHNIDPSTLSDMFQLNKPGTFVDIIERIC